MISSSGYSIWHSVAEYSPMQMTPVNSCMQILVPELGFAGLVYYSPSPLAIPATATIQSTSRIFLPVFWACQGTLLVVT